jgi:hypothetical protein
VSNVCIVISGQSWCWSKFNSRRLDTNSDMFEDDMERDFGGSGLDAWLILVVDPATDTGRDMAFRYDYPGPQLDSMV